VTLATGVLVQPLTKRFGRRSDLLGLALGALGIALGARAVAVLSPSLAFAAAVLLGAGYGLVMTTGLIEISDRVPRPARGGGAGIYYVLPYVGFVLPFGPAVTARPLGDVVTLTATAVVVAACLATRAAIKAVVAARRVG